jgi:hypothetical protein
VIKCEANESICGSGWTSARAEGPLDRSYVDAFCTSLRRPALSMESNNSGQATGFNNVHSKPDRSAQKYRHCGFTGAPDKGLTRFIHSHLMKTVILRTHKRTKSNSFSDALFRTHFLGRTFSDAIFRTLTVAHSVGLFSKLARNLPVLNQNAFYFLKEVRLVILPNS